MMSQIIRKSKKKLNFLELLKKNENKIKLY
jgi:hypothetical protein